MSLFFRASESKPDETSANSIVPDMAPAPTKERIYSELIAQRPALLDEKLKLHQLIIDEFNLAVLDKMSRDELLKIVLGYAGEYVRTEKISLNQKELQQLAEALLLLTEDQQEAVILHHLHGRKLTDVAAQLDRSPEATAGLVHRGLKKLKELLRGREGEAPAEPLRD